MTVSHLHSSPLPRDRRSVFNVPSTYSSPSFLFPPITILPKFGSTYSQRWAISLRKCEGHLILPQHSRAFGCQDAEINSGGLRLEHLKEQKFYFNKSCPQRGRLSEHVVDSTPHSSKSNTSDVLAGATRGLVKGSSWEVLLNMKASAQLLGIVVLGIGLRLALNSPTPFVGSKYPLFASVSIAQDYTIRPKMEHDNYVEKLPHSTALADAETSRDVGEPLVFATNERFLKKSQWKISGLLPTGELDHLKVQKDNDVFDSAKELAESSNAEDNLEPDLNDDDRRNFEEWRAQPYVLTVPIRIVGLRSSVPPIWLKDFISSQGKRARLVPEFRSSLKAIFEELTIAKTTGKLSPQSAMAADLVTIGDSWLGKAVSGGLIKPIENADQYLWYHQLGTKWKVLVRRNKDGQLDPNGKVWGVPYRWGSLVIAYNSVKFRKNKVPAIQDWSDLWKPELAGRVAMVSSPRDVVGAVLKALGASFNVNNFDRDIPGGRKAVREKFKCLQKQVRLFDDMHYLKALGSGEVWVVVGWSGDVIPFAKRSSSIAVIVPKSGTSLWADLWAIPATTSIQSSKVGGRVRGPSPLIFQWLEFCLQPARACSFQEDIFVGASPLLLAGSKLNDKSSFQIDVDCNKRVGPSFETNLEGGLIPPEILAKSEFLEPLGRAAEDDFNWLLSHPDVKPKQSWDVKDIFKRISNWRG